MFTFIDGAYVSTEVQMLLSSSTVRACVIGLGNPSRRFDSSVRYVKIEKEKVLLDCISMLAKIDNLFVKPAAVDGQSGSIEYMAYFSGAKEKNLESECAVECSLSHALFDNTPCHHLTITSVDLPLQKLALSSKSWYLRSLDLSRLNLSDDDLVKGLLTARFAYLRWLDLAGNHGITEHGISAIARSVCNGDFPSLKWLNLVGTSCDASPYVDGYSWRMTKTAHQLAASFGYQPWMMLGSRQPNMEDKELLSDIQRSVPPDRFNPI